VIKVDARPAARRRRARVVRRGHRLGFGHQPCRPQPGDTVVVVGIGGIGINAVQGAKMAGAKHVIAVDPVEFKREKAMEFGATHTFASMEEALPRSPSSPGARWPTR
jgi:Zn-dependent alcohol dehydrogenase